MCVITILFLFLATSTTESPDSLSEALPPSFHAVPLPGDVQEEDASISPDSTNTNRSIVQRGTVEVNKVKSGGPQVTANDRSTCSQTEVPGIADNERGNPQRYVVAHHPSEKIELTSCMAKQEFSVSIQHMEIILCIHWYHILQKTSRVLFQQRESKTIDREGQKGQKDGSEKYVARQIFNESACWLYTLLSEAKQDATGERKAGPSRKAKGKAGKTSTYHIIFPKYQKTDPHRSSENRKPENQENPGGASKDAGTVVCK